MKDFRLFVQIIIVLFLLGKATTTLMDLKVNDLEAAQVVASLDGSQEPAEEDDTMEEDDEIINADQTLHFFISSSLSNTTFHRQALLESVCEVTVPPPQV